MMDFNSSASVSGQLTTLIDAGMQRDAGAVGLTVATIGEAEAFAAAGFDDLFIAYKEIG